jgi:hypothetical protein
MRCLQCLTICAAQGLIASAAIWKEPAVPYEQFRKLVEESELHAWLSSSDGGPRIPGAFEAEAERFVSEAHYHLSPSSSEDGYSGATLTGLHLRERLGRMLNSTASILNSTALVPFKIQAGGNSTVHQPRLRGSADKPNSTALVASLLALTIRNETARISLPNTADMPSLPTGNEGGSFLDALFDSILQHKMLLPPTSFTKANCGNASRGITLMSGSDRNAMFIGDTVANHQAFAQRHCYDYLWHKGNKAAPRQPYWSKIAMLRHALQHQKQQKFFIWLDDDVVITNLALDMLGRALREHPEDIIVTTDANRKIASLNTGIIIVRNTKRAAELLDEVWARGLRGRRGVSLAFASQDDCLHEQEALEEMYHEGYEGIAVIRQRSEERLGTEGQHFNLNTFLRWSHFNSKRQLHQRFPDDSADSKWRKGDFIGHCSGLSQVRRAMCVSALLASVVGGSETGL